jgi:hypothetical protein
MWYWIYLLFSYNYKSCVETATSNVEEECKPVSATACQQPIAFTSTPDPVRPEFVSPCVIFMSKLLKFDKIKSLIICNVFRISKK